MNETLRNILAGRYETDRLGRHFDLFKGLKEESLQVIVIALIKERDVNAVKSMQADFPRVGGKSSKDGKVINWTELLNVAFTETEIQDRLTEIEEVEMVEKLEIISTREAAGVLHIMEVLHHMFATALYTPPPRHLTALEELDLLEKEQARIEMAKKVEEGRVGFLPLPEKYAAKAAFNEEWNSTMEELVSLMTPELIAKASESPKWGTDEKPSRLRVVVEQVTNNTFAPNEYNLKGAQGAITILSNIKGTKPKDRPAYTSGDRGGKSLIPVVDSSKKEPKPLPWKLVKHVLANFTAWDEEYNTPLALKEDRNLGQVDWGKQSQKFDQVRTSGKRSKKQKKDK